MKSKLLFIFLVSLMAGQMAVADDTPAPAPAPKYKKKTQKVEFDSEMIDGQARHPDGTYVVQKRGVDFIPLYKIREGFDDNIRSSINYLK